MKTAFFRPVAFALGACLLLSGAASADDKAKKAESPADLLAKAAKLKPDFSNAEEQEKALTEYFGKLIPLLEQVEAHKESSLSQKDEARKRKAMVLYQMGQMDPKKAKAFEEYADKLQKEVPGSSALGAIAVYRFAGKHLKGRGEGMSDAAISEAKELAKKHPDEPMVGQILTMVAMQLEQSDVEKAKTFLRDAIKLAPKTKSLEGMLKGMSIVGTAMEINGPTLKGSEFNISSLKGKVVLVDFWATWCGPCVGEIPTVLEVYKKYHKDGFEVVAVSLDQERDELVKFVKEKELPWTQIFFEPKPGEHPLAGKYGINAIPATFLIGRDGKVVAKGLRGEKLEPAVKKELEKKIGGPKAN